ncbi:hypothetical protein niasHT_014103 [Heterodera trifolii]|uniref:Serine aminopeptidase S33 domain-containing protein n=1 Tax=Heterodera trifolii TaxID=157864 RepID=A0ABD2LGF5_9BILA
MRSPPLRLLFCHGLGAAKTDAQLMGQWARQKQIEFQIIQYKNYGDPSSVWAVNQWVRDIGVELARDQNAAVAANNPSRGTVAACASAGAQALLRALWHSPLLAQHLAGLLLLSPGVCMEVPNYVQRVLPDQWDALRAGLPVDHPSADRTIQLRINMDSLKDYERNCVIRRDSPLAPLHFPIRIVHGLYDKLVPIENCVELLQRLPARDKAMHVVPCGHVITDTTTMLFALDSLWAQICRRREEENAAERQNAKVPEAILR